MKKRVILLSLAICIGMVGFAQTKAKSGHNFPKNAVTVKHEVKAFGNELTAPIDFVAPTTIVSAENTVRDNDFSDWKTMTTKYDLQTNQALSNRAYQWPNGDFAVTATWGVADPMSWSDRGTGYNFYTAANSSFNSQPNARIENTKTGWPTISTFGQNGEIVVAHTGTGLLYYTRATRGTGTWNGPFQILNPLEEGVTGLVGTPELTWPRITVSGANNEYVHLIAATQELATDTAYYLFYKRGTVSGDTVVWETSRVIEESTLILTAADGTDSIYPRSFFTADSYSIASNGNTVSILLIDSWNDMILIKSTDNGQTWNSEVIWDFPLIGDSLLSLSQIWSTMTDSLDTIWVPNGGGSITVDNNGLTHVVFSLALVRPVPENYYTYWLGFGVDGVVYWNENMPKISVPELPDNVDPRYAYLHSEKNALNPYGYVGYIDEAGDTIWDEYGLIYRPDTEAHLIGGYAIDAADEDPSYDPGTFQLDNDHVQVYYGHKGNSDYPAITVDANGNLVVSYSCMSTYRTSNGDYLRNGYVSYYSATDDYWYFNRYNLSRDWTHNMDEVWYVTSAPFSHNGDFWTVYSADYQIGNYLNSSNDGYENPQTAVTSNFIYAVKINPQPGESVGMKEQEAKSALTQVDVVPNPIENNVINLVINASFDTDASVAIYNLAGQSVYNAKIDALSMGLNQRSINVNLTSGIYFCTVTTANGFQETKKVVVK